ncbi:Major facilitator superfamily domain general substrate transporter [Penicillium expansum]|nr:Major facilitator superfamily domain general substrate transporter [Penicillium expansum]
MPCSPTFQSSNEGHQFLGRGYDKSYNSDTIIEGAVTFGIAGLGIFMLPDHPLTTRWLTPEERQLAHDRIQRDTVSLDTAGKFLYCPASTEDENRRAPS